MIRAFIGLPLPQTYQDQLESLRARWNTSLASKLAWTKKGNWHLTLKFLGNVEEQALAPLCLALKNVSITSYALQGGGGGFFPTPSPPKPLKPRVIWVGLAQGAQQTCLLAQNVEKTVLPLGFAKETRPFSPHLTLARVKMAQKDSWLDILQEMQAMKWPVLKINHFVLWKSKLGPQGPSYTMLEEFSA